MKLSKRKKGKGKMNVIDIIIKIILWIVAIDTLIIVAGVIVFIGMILKDKFFKK